MTTAADGAAGRIRSFWRRTLLGPSLGARSAIYEELATLLGAGIGLRESLRSANERHSGVRRQLVELLAQGVDRDRSLSETMRANPDRFGPVEAALVSTGERTGRLDLAFRSAAAELERRREMRGRLLLAVAYPLVLFHGFVLMCSAVRMFRGDSFLALALPSLLGFWGGLFAVACIHAVFAERASYARFVRKIPALSRTVRSGALARFARAFALLHGGGLPYDEVLRTAAEASGDAVLRAETALAVGALARGATLSMALAEIRSIPSDDRGLLVAGEQAGELEGAANRVATLEEERFDAAVRRMTALLRGVLVAIMSVVIGAYVISFYSSMFDSAMQGL